MSSKQKFGAVVDKIRGRIKDAVGKQTGNRRMQAEGKVDKGKGAAREKVEETKDAFKTPDRPQ